MQEYLDVIQVRRYATLSLIKVYTNNSYTGLLTTLLSLSIRGICVQLCTFKHCTLPYGGNQGCNEVQSLFHKLATTLPTAGVSSYTCFKNHSAALASSTIGNSPLFRSIAALRPYVYENSAHSQACSYDHSMHLKTVLYSR